MPITKIAGSTGGGSSPYAPSWQSFSFTYEDFAESAFFNQIVMYALPAKNVVHSVVVKHEEAFSGGGITTYQVSVGTSAAPTKYASAFDLMQAPGDAVAQISDGDGIEDFVNPVNLVLNIISTGAVLDQATQGALTVWLLTSQLP